MASARLPPRRRASRSEGSARTNASAAPSRNSTTVWAIGATTCHSTQTKPRASNPASSTSTIVSQSRPAARGRTGASVVGATARSWSRDTAGGPAARRAGSTARCRRRRGALEGRAARHAGRRRLSSRSVRRPDLTTLSAVSQAGAERPARPRGGPATGVGRTGGRSGATVWRIGPRTVSVAASPAGAAVLTGRRRGRRPLPARARGEGRVERDAAQGPQPVEERSERGLGHDEATGRGGRRQAQGEVRREPRAHPQGREARQRGPQAPRPCPAPVAAS